MEKINEEPTPKTSQESTSDCAICYQQNTNSCFTTHCDHTFCQDCMTKWLLVNNNCPLCRTNLTNSTNDVDDDYDDDDSFVENRSFEMTIVVPPMLNVPESMLRLGLLRAHNLTTVLNHDDTNEEFVIPNLMTNWVIQKPRTVNGWRPDDCMFRTTVAHKGVHYAIYVEPLAEDHETNNLFLASSNICYVKTYIIPLSYNSHLEIPYSKQNAKQQRKQTKYRIHKNTTQRRQRYTHH